MREISPINRSKSQARKYYSQISKFYDWLTAGEKRFIKKGVDLLGIKPGEKIADVGCGTGVGIKYIQKKLSPKGRLIGLDISHQMLLESRTKIGSNHSGPYLVQGDTAKSPFKPDQFDSILCTFTLELFPMRDIPVVLNEFRRILRPGGGLVIISLGQEPHTIAVNIYEWLHKQFPVAFDCRPIPLAAFLNDSGFKIKVSETEIYWGLPIESVLCQSSKKLDNS